MGRGPVEPAEFDGTVALTNNRERPAALEITRQVPGNVDAADHRGEVEMLNPPDDSDAPVGNFPSWWDWYNWPDRWAHFNGLGRVTWKLSLPTQQSLGYTRHYFWH